MFLARASDSITVAEIMTDALAPPCSEGAYSRFNRANSHGCKRRALFLPPSANTPASYFSFGVILVLLFAALIKKKILTRVENLFIFFIIRLVFIGITQKKKDEYPFSIFLNLGSRLAI